MVANDGARTGAVALRHAPTGALLSDGRAPVRFADAASAGAFRRRYLDEVEAWETVPAADALRAA